MAKPWEDAALIRAVRERCLQSKDITAERFNGLEAAVLLAQGWAKAVHHEDKPLERRGSERIKALAGWGARPEIWYSVLRRSDWNGIPAEHALDLKGKIGPMKKAAEFLQHAAVLVGADRETSHGPKKRNHDNIAALWQAYLDIRFDRDAPLSAVDVAHMMALLKVARTQLGNFNPDDYVDMAGYAGVAAEIRVAHLPAVVQP